MADATTPNLGMTKPTVGADSNSWGGLLNGNLDILDAAFAGPVSPGRVPLTNASVTWSGTITAGGFSGPLTGDVTGNVSGSAGSCTGNAATATTAGSCAGNAATATTAGAANYANYANSSGYAGSAGACSGNAASASTASRVDFANGAAIDFDGTSIRFFVGGSCVAYFNQASGVVSNV